jgi:hypothetical protein
MLFGKKSDLKNHLSAKHPTWAHKVVARPAHEQALEADVQERSLPERDPPPKVERPEFVRSQS